MEQTLADLQRRVERLEAKRRPTAKSSWREAFGFAKGDSLSARRCSAARNGGRKPTTRDSSYDNDR